MATIYYADGTEKEVSPLNGVSFSLEELQSIVDGHIEVVPMRDGIHIMVVNEEYRYLDLAKNEKATKIAELPSQEEREEAQRQYRAMGIFVIDATDFQEGEEDYIAGNALYCLDQEVR